MSLLAQLDGSLEVIVSSRGSFCGPWAWMWCFHATTALTPHQGSNSSAPAAQGTAHLYTEPETESKPALFEPSDGNFCCHM